MNDFTKEELEIIKYWCREDHRLVEKLYSLINNYCEHKESVTNQNYGVKECKKCGMKSVFIKPLGPVFWAGMLIGYGIGGIMVTLFWVLK